MNNTDKEESIEAFKRSNFFPGLQAGPTFWNAMVDYHYRKENLYNMLFHGYGVVSDFLGSFDVQAEKTKGGLLTLLVAPGMAIDRLGRGIFLDKPEILVVDIKRYKLPSNVYVIARYEERLEEYYQNKENSDLQGYQKRYETARFEITDEVKQDGLEIEIARIRLEEEEGGGVSEIRNTDEYCDPGANALDFRYVPWVNRAKKGVSQYLKRELVEVLENTRSVADSSCAALNLNVLRNLQTVAMTGKMIMQTNGVGLDDIIHIISPLFDMDHQVLFGIAEWERERKEEGRTYTTRSGYETARAAMYSFGDRLKAFETKGSDAYAELEGMLRDHRAVMKGLRETLVTQEISEDDIKYISSEMPPVLLYEEQRYTLIDTINFGITESVESHKVRYEGSAHPTVSNESFFYPDGERVPDTVRRWIGGSMKFVLRNLVKNRRLLIVRRTDIHRGDYTVNVELGEGVTATMDIEGVDTKFRWRNTVAVFDEGYVKENAVEAAFRAGEQVRDNSGKIWAYQAL